MRLKNTLILLRVPFSLFLLPNFLFAFSQVPEKDILRCWIVAIILHLLIYPASNGYNSYMDRDTESIGGLEHPPLPDKSLFFTTLVLDILSIVFSAFVNLYFFAGIVIYILCSRLYSYRGIRLKRFPVAGFLTVFLVQGAVTFCMVYMGINVHTGEMPPLLCVLAASLLIGALYPLTQIYQHRQDLSDGVRTISYLLGYRGTFLFSALLFTLANITLFFYFREKNALTSFYIFTIGLSPAVAYFFYWMLRAWKDLSAINFRNSLRMNIIASFCTNISFIVLSFFQSS